MGPACSSYLSVGWGEVGGASLGLNEVGGACCPGIGWYEVGVACLL